MNDMDPNITIVAICAAVLAVIWVVSWICALHCPRCDSRRTVLASEWECGETWRCRWCGHHWICDRR